MSEFLFTIHFATINTKIKKSTLKILYYLQYTLLLLILSLFFCFPEIISEFTIHFATINTPTVPINIESIIVFTIHFATINTKYLAFIILSRSSFTIHFATINT